MPLYSPDYYNAAALIGGASPRRRKFRRSGMTGMDMIRRSVKVRKGSPEAKAKMAALRRIRDMKRRRRGY